MSEIFSSQQEAFDPNGWRGNETAWWDLSNVSAEASTLPENFKEIEEIEEIGEVALDATVDFPGKEEDQPESTDPSIEAVYSPETISEKSILSLTIDGKRTNFTELKHYTPKVEATSEVYPIPSHLVDIMTSDKGASFTYERTTKEPRWQEKLFDFTQDFLKNDPRGRVLIDGFGITSLTQLTPEQGVKLSVGIVEMLSKYAEGDPFKAGDIADEKTTLQLLYEAKMKNGNSDWKGNVVCRNIASNIRAVFEALKDGQSEQSMLGNTYAVATGEMRGRSYGVRERDNPNGTEKDDRYADAGHAWNTFVTIGKNGDSAITTVDVTFALKDARPDYTIERTYESIQKLYEQADDKYKASVEMVHYLDKFIHRARADKAGCLEQRLGFAFTEYLKYADVMLKENSDMIITPGIDVLGRAYKIRGDLTKKEVETVFGIGKATDDLESHDTAIKGVIDSFIERTGDETDKLVVADDDLQRLIFDHIGDRLGAVLSRDKIRLGGNLSRRFNQVMGSR